jgi:DNA polymerase-4
MPRTIVHIDMDAFYAAIEQRDQPRLRGRSVVVGGHPDSRGVVSSASYEAREFGVRSAMPSAEAKRLCPEAVFVPVDMPKYSDVSAQLMGLLETFTPTIEPLSVDEAFLDITGTEQLFGPPIEVARSIKAAVREQLNLTASVGIAPNKFTAKIASDAEKPDGLVVVRDGEVESFLAQLPIRRLWGIGEATEQRLRRLGIRTVGELAGYPRESLIKQFGQGGEQLSDLAHGIDERPVQTEREAKSLSSEITFEEDIGDYDQLEAVLFDLSEQVAWRLRKKGLRARTFTLKVRFSDFRTLTRSRSRRRPANHGPEVFQVASALLGGLPMHGRRVRLLGVAATQLCGEGDEVQLTLFDDYETERAKAIDETLDAIRERFGRDAIGRGRRLARDA